MTHLNNGSGSLRVLILIASVLVISGCDEDLEGPPDSPSELIVDTRDQLRGILGVKLGSAIDTQVGITPFPPDLTVDAISLSRGIVSANGDLYTVQLDNGVPWEAALTDAGYEEKLLSEWESHRSSRSDHQDIYLAIAPLKMDRSFWADGYEGKTAPKWVAQSRALSDEMKTAYANYALKAVSFFEPKYLNLGVEAGELVEKDPELWREMAVLYRETRRAVKERYPDLLIGMSFTLPAMMPEGNLELCREVFDDSDYVGISFYPYLDDFYRFTTGVSLKPPPNQWREPLDWLKENVSKPIAICETGYSSSPIKVKTWDLDMQGDPSTQEQYVSELAEIAARDNYLFTVFFLSVDYDRLAARMPESSDVLALWKRTGFFDENFRAKPAWQAYRRDWLGVTSELAGQLSAALANGIRDKVLATSGTPEIKEIVGPQSSRGLSWKFQYDLEFEYLTLEATSWALESAEELTIWIRSDRSSAVLLQIEEGNGEAFFAVLKPSVEWRQLVLNSTNFSPDPGKRGDGVIDWSEISTVMLADGAVKDSGATGSRQVDVALEAF